MDTFGNILSGVGLFMCVGAVLVVALVVFAVRSMSGGRNKQGTNADVWRERGTEQPRYNDPDIQSTGGFGGVPTTGPDDTDFTTRGNSGGFGTPGVYNSDRPARQRPIDDDEDDNIRSSGGFGG